MENIELETGVVENECEYEDALQELDLEELLSKCTIELNTEEVQNLKLNKTKVQNGINDISYEVGRIVGLCNCGMNIKDATDFVLQLKLNEDTIKHNQELQRMNNENAIEVSSINANTIEKNSI